MPDCNKTFCHPHSLYCLIPHYSCEAITSYSTCIVLSPLYDTDITIVHFIQLHPSLIHKLFSIIYKALHPAKVDCFSADHVVHFLFLRKDFCLLQGCFQKNYQSYVPVTHVQTELSNLRQNRCERNSPPLCATRIIYLYNSACMPNHPNKQPETTNKSCSVSFHFETGVFWKRVFI